MPTVLKQCNIISACIGAGATISHKINLIFNAYIPPEEKILYA